MISRELLDELQQLDRTDKLAIIQMLTDELAVDEAKYFIFGANYDVWSPYDAPEAAKTLLRMLDDEQEDNGRPRDAVNPAGLRFAQ